MDKDSSLTFRLPEATRSALERAAEADKRSMSSLAVLILEGWLTEQGFLAVPKRVRKPKRG